MCVCVCVCVLKEDVEQKVRINPPKKDEEKSKREKY